MDAITKNEAIARIDEYFRDGGNGHYNFESARDYLVEGLREAQREGDEYVFIKPPSGYEMEIEIEVVRAALGR